MSEKPLPGADDQPDVDARLRPALRDDLPPAVARRLERTTAAEIARRRRGPALLRLLGVLDPVVPSPLLTRLAVPAALVLLASGTLLQGTPPPAASLVAVSRVSLVASASQALRGAGPLLCGAGSAPEGFDPETLAARAYRSWVLVAAERTAAGTMRLVFLAPHEDAGYEVVVDASSFRPRAIRRTPLAGAPGATDECAWPAQRTPGSPEGSPR